MRLLAPAAPALIVLLACAPAQVSTDPPADLPADRPADRAAEGPADRPVDRPAVAVVEADTLAGGVVARWTRDPSGPWSVHVVEIDPDACGVEVRSIKAGDALVGRALTSELAAALSAAEGRPALAAVNADFFSFDPPGVPTGLHVQSGQIVSPPSARPAFTVGDVGPFFAGTTRLDAGVRLPDGRQVTVDAVNRHGHDGVALLNRFAPDPLEAAGRTVAWIRPLDSPFTTGDTIRGIVATLDTAASDPAATVRLAWPPHGEPGEPVVSVVPGDTLRWWTGLEGPPGPVREAVGGTPVLVRDGRNIVAEADLAPAFRDRRHPRTAVGWRADGVLLLVVVDGRAPGHSDGMSLHELAELMIASGAVAALNLDGGGSTTLVVGGRVANRPSDARVERPVANALVVLGPAVPGECA